MKIFRLVMRGLAYVGTLIILIGYVIGLMKGVPLTLDSVFGYIILLGILLEGKLDELLEKKE